MDGLFRDFGDFGSIFNLMLLRIVPVLLCITIHELAHGFTAYKLGDRTAKDMGRLTLNPIKHIDPVGLLMMLLVRFGWAKPVPVNMRNFKHPKWYMAITALAGPVSNILLAGVLFFILGLVITPLGLFYSFETSNFYLNFATTTTGLTIFEIFTNAIFISIAFAIFNMLPLPPLDGSKVLFALVPERHYFKLMRYERYGMLVLLVIMGSRFFFGIDILGGTIVTLTQTIQGYLQFIFEVSYRLVN